MKRIFFAALFCAALPLAARCAGEDQLLAVLKSDSSLQDKDAPCAQLKWTGTPRSIPVLAGLLTNDDLSHSARYALESMPDSVAENALLQALARTAGSNQVGIIDSLAVRQDPAAVPNLSPLLSNTDPATATAAANALGHIGGAKAIKALQSAWKNPASGPLHRAQTDGLLACANKLLTSGDKSKAGKLFQEIYEHEQEGSLRLAAFRGEVLAAGDAGTALLAKAIAGGEAPCQGAALQLASKVRGTAATKALADLLPKVAPPVQIALLQCLELRADPSAQSQVVLMLDSKDAGVRVAAITALGDFGDGSVAVLLARKAATGNRAEKTAARQSLTTLHRGPVTAQMLAALDSAAPDAQIELIRALGDRADAAAAPKMLVLARSNDDSIRSAALQAVALLAGPGQVTDLVQLVVNAGNEDIRSGAADALAAVCQHIESRDGKMDAAPLVQGMQGAPLEARVALLGVCSEVSDPQIRAAVLAALSDTDARAREAALRSLCNTHDPLLLPELLKVACASDDGKFRLLAVGGCVRLATRDEYARIATATKLDALKAMLDTKLNTAEKRLVLAGLGTIHDPQALALATPLLDDRAVRPEAAQAIIHIAGSISTAQPEEAGAALKKILAMSINPATQKSAEQAYKKLQ